MAEAIALAASIIAVVQIADRVATVSKSLIETVQDYPRDLRLVYIETGSLKVIFESLRFLNQDDPADSATLERLRGSDGPVEGCKTAMEQLDRLLPSLPLPTSKRNGAKRIKIQTVLASLAWPLKAEKARKLLDEIMLHKSTINVALQGQLLAEFRNMKHQLDEVHISLNESEKRKVYEWCQATNPSSSHNAAAGLYEDKTGDWVFRTPEWDAWIHSRARALWIHGIPGAGKTILAAHIIERTFRVCESKDKRTTCVYYYCYHGHNQDESAPLLRWLVSQLLRAADTVPTLAWKAYTKDTEPNTTLLLDILYAILESFDLVYVAIDALDESQNRHHLLDIVNVLITDSRFRKIQLLATSREYADIELKMDAISLSLSMANCVVEEDIKVYIMAKLRAEAKFQRWPLNLRNDVTVALTTGAKGMFRWVVCQLDILRRLNHQSKIREALKCLPETLDETYDRIFSYIADEQRDFVRFLLHFICLHDLLWKGEVPLGAKLLIDAYIASNKGEGRLRSDEYLCDVETMKDSCGCLVSFTFDLDSQSLFIDYAHYTVREFLESNRWSMASYFKIEQKDSYGSILNFILEYVITSEPIKKSVMDGCDHEHTPLELSSTSSLQEYCVAASVCSLKHEVLVDPKLAFRLLDPFEAHYDSLYEAFYLFSSSGFPNMWLKTVSRGFWDINWHESTKSCKIPILAHLLLLGCYRLAKVFLQELDVQNALPITLFGSLSAGSLFWLDDPNSPNEFECNLIELLAQVGEFGVPELIFFEQEVHGLVCYTNLLPYYMTGHSHYAECNLMCENSCVLPQLLKLGANPDPKGFQVTPLQMAVYDGDIAGVRALLQAGADPNNTGDGQGIKWHAEKSILGRYCHLHGLTPLDILRRLNGDPDLDALTSDVELHHTNGTYNDAIACLLLDHNASVEA